MNTSQWNITSCDGDQLNPRIEGLVDIRASMYVMAIIVVRELGIINLVVGHEIYKTNFGIVIKHLEGSFKC